MISACGNSHDLMIRVVATSRRTSVGCAFSGGGLPLSGHGFLLALPLGLPLVCAGIGFLFPLALDVGLLLRVRVGRGLALPRRPCC